MAWNEAISPCAPSSVAARVCNQVKQCNSQETKQTLEEFLNFCVAFLFCHLQSCYRLIRPVIQKAFRNWLEVLFAAEILPMMPTICLWPNLYLHACTLNCLMAQRKAVLSIKRLYTWCIKQPGSLTKCFFYPLQTKSPIFEWKLIFHRTNCSFVFLLTFLTVAFLCLNAGVIQI